MNLTNKYTFTFVSFILSWVCQAQNADTLGFQQFINQVGKYHPVAKQSALIPTTGEEEVKAARGGFDPILYGSHNSKELNESVYYNKQDLGIRLPTFGGIELDANYERNSGNYLNPEVTNTAGLLSAGIQLNLGRDLFIDQRRAALRQAQFFAEQSKEEQRQMLNKLFEQSAQAYWFWSRTQADVAVLEKGVELAIERFEAVKESFRLGDLPAIDTVEAYTQVQAIQQRYLKAQNNLYVSKQELITYLWDDDLNPLELKANILPQGLESTQNLEPVNQEEYLNLLESHPALKIQDYQIKQAEVDRRFKADRLKPKVFVKYNYLTEETGTVPDAALFTNNYTLGFGVSSSLFLRRERGRLNIADLNLKEQRFRRTDTYALLKADLQNTINTYENTIDRLNIFKSNVINLQRLLEAEQARFNMGESSLFLINTREIRYIEAQTVLNVLQAEALINFAELKAVSGTAWQSFLDN